MPHCSALLCSIRGLLPDLIPRQLAALGGPPPLYPPSLVCTRASSLSVLSNQLTRCRNGHPMCVLQDVGMAFEDVPRSGTYFPAASLTPGRYNFRFGSEVEHKPYVKINKHQPIAVTTNEN